MKKNFFYVALGLMGIMGTLSIGIVSADTTCWSTYGGTVPTTPYASGIVYGCDGDIPIITIYGKNGNNEDVGITIKAMNEGTGTVIIGTGESSYGSYYQWGNNFPFSDAITLSGYTLVNASENLNASGYYYSGYFVKASGGEWDSSRNYNLRGGSGDSQNYSGAYYGFNTGSFTVINAEGRQAMCPDGYHIPSAGEWNALFYLWDSRGVNTKLGVKLNEKERIRLYSLQNRRQLSDDLYLPIAGYRYYSNPSINENESLAVYWSSSSLDEGRAWPFAINLSNNYIELDYYNYGYKTTAKPIRCFKNSYVEPSKTLNLYFMTGTDATQEIGSGTVTENMTGSVPVTVTTAMSNVVNTGYTFSGSWSLSGETIAFDFENTPISGDWADASGNVYFIAQWEVNVHKLNFVVDGTTIQSGDVAYAAAISAPAEPKKDCNSFAGWTSSVEGLTTTGTMPDSDVTFTANWNYTCSRSSGGGGGGSSRNTEKTTETQTGSKVDSSTKATDSEDNTQDSSVKASEGQNQGKTYSDEFQQAYEFAYKHGITTMPTVEQANMEGPLTRIAMAKMLSYYAINVLGLKPDTSRKIKFRDVSDKMDAEYNNAVSLAYQLGIMGINMPKNRFRPNDLVTRAEFATALSRMLYKIADGKDKYYSTHLAKLMEEKIITNDNPDLQELRGYVMIMLMRSAK